MGLFKTGFQNYAQDLESTKRERDYLNKFFMKQGEMKEVVFLDDTGFRFWMYTIVTPRNAQKFNSIELVCNTEDPAKCVLSQMGFQPSYVTVLTLKNLTGYFKNDGSKGGVNEKQLLILKPKSAKLLDEARKTVLNNKAEEMWNNQRQLCQSKGYNGVEDVKTGMLAKGNILKNTKFSISRTDAQSPGTGNYFMFQRWVKQEELLPADIPFVYEDLFQIKTDKELVDEVTKFHAENGMPMPFISGVVSQQTVNTPINQNINTNPALNAGASQPQMNVVESAIAVPMSDDDIPF